jgi:branched-chain amino acid aminotransferase
MKLPRWVWVNGALHPSRRPALSAFDRGFLYGDGVYETLLIHGGKPLLWGEHLRRLRASARGIGLAFPAGERAIRRGLARLLKANRHTEAVVRLTLSRGPAPLGFDPRLARRPTLVMISLAFFGHPAAVYERGMAVGIAEIRRNPRESLDPALKSTNNLNNILAKREALAMKVDEAVMMNTRNELAEGTISNIFFVRRKTVFTPHLTCGILAGVTRETVIRLARRRGWAVREGRFGPGDLLRADEVFLTSTTLGVAPVRLIKWLGRIHRVGAGTPGPAARALGEDYRGFLEAHC